MFSSNNPETAIPVEAWLGMVATLSGIAVVLILLYLLVKAAADRVIDGPAKSRTATRHPARREIPLKTMDELRSGSNVYPDTAQGSPDVYEDYYDRMQNVIFNGGVMGKPGNLLSASQQFDKNHFYAGLEGEVKIAEYLENFVVNRSETLHLFHSLQWPSHVKTRADIDHILVYGNNILIIDSKNWASNSTYSFGPLGNITKNGQPMSHSAVPSVFGAREELLVAFTRNHPDLYIETATCIYGKNIVLNQSKIGEVHYLTNTQFLYRFLHNWISAKDKNLPSSTGLIHSIMSLL